MITGGSTGIGYAFAERFARQGHRLVLVARDEVRLRKASGRLAQVATAPVDCLAADLTVAADRDRVAARLEGVDLLVNNAGLAARGAIAQLDVRSFEEMMALNTVALAHLASRALACMMATGSGTIINVASGTAFMQMPGNAGYGASKSFVVAFTRHMQAEAAGSGVFVQLLIPGVIDTPFHERAGTSVDRFPQGIVMTPDDLVNASLRGIELGETVCIPSMTEVANWEAFVAAESKVGANVSRMRPATRYSSHGNPPS